MKNSGYERISALDALRGMAVLLMLEQHLGFWLWDMGGNSTQIEGLLIDHPIMVGINGLGGLAAPIFITLAGVGSILLQSRHGHGPILLIKRGIVMLLFGYILNLLGRDWFTVGSWYVLHLIGISLIIAPLLHRLKTPVLAVLLLVTLLVAVGLQDYLKTPLLMDDRFMTDYDRAGGIIRLSLAEGHFPIFPWIFLFITGIIAGRWINARKLRNCILLGLSFLVIASAMLSFHYFTPAPAVVGPYSRALLPSLTFYPAMPIMVLMLASAVLFILVIFASVFVGSFVKNWPYDFSLTFAHFDFPSLGGYGPLWTSFWSSVLQGNLQSIIAYKYAPIWNSFWVSIFVAVGGAVLTLLAGYIIEKKRPRGSQVLYILSVLPAAIPGTVLGLGYILAFNKPFQGRRIAVIDRAENLA